MSDLDYRFSWRWLLPIARGDHVLLIGFTEYELVFLEQALEDASITEDASEAAVCLINDLSADCVAGLDLVQLRCLCVVGSSKVVDTWHKWMDGRFTEVNDYALLPSRKPRVVVPMGRVDWVMQGLALHRPGRLIARLAVALLKGFARVGIDRPLRVRTICIANKDAGILSQGVRHTGLELSSAGAPRSFALYLGAPSVDRKTVILPLGGAEQKILKQGESSKAKAALHNEAVALQEMARTSLAAQVPVLFDIVERNGSVTLHQEYRSRKYLGAASMHQAAEAFLVVLSQQERHARPLADVLEQLDLLTVTEARSAGKMVYAKVRGRLDTLAASGAMVWGHRGHGDFAPWNCSWTNKGFFVFDWEASRSWYVALSDAFYLVLAPAIHVIHSCEPAVVESKALILAADIAEKASLDIEDIRMYWGLWLLKRISQEPVPLCEELLERLVVSWH